jgi:PAS domain S-box-containing protein
MDKQGISQQTGARSAAIKYQSPSLLKQIIDFLPDATFVIDKKGFVIAWNKAMERLTKISAGEMVGKGDMEYSLAFYPSKRPVLIDLVNNPDAEILSTYSYVKRCGDTLVSETPPGVHLYGSGCYLNVACPLYDEDGNVTGAIECIRDITEIKKNEIALRESEAKYHNLFQYANDAIFLIEGGRVVECNDKALELFDCSRDELLLTLPHELSPDFQPDGKRSREKAREKSKEALDGKAQSFEWRHLRPNGTSFDSLVSLSAFRSDGRRYLLAVIRDITDQKRKEEELRENEERFRALFKVSPDAVTLTRLSDGMFVDINDGFAELSGYSREDVIGRTSHELGIWTEMEDRNKLIAELQREGACRNFEVRLNRKDGTVGIGLMSARLLVLGGLPHILSVVRDVSALKRAEEQRRILEAQLAQAQRLESIGRLAGGIAHDFNNMLGVILGRADLALATLDKSNVLFRDMMEIRKAAQRSAELTKRLLGFARRQPAEPRVIDLNESIKSMLSMLKRLIGENIELIWLPGESLMHVKLDPAQLDQILANLCINARDAISDVGRITIETQNIHLSEDYCSKTPYVVPGEYVSITLSDTGCGMDKDVLQKIFEPFFTTKEEGKGTGLGLATVYGIVKQNDGYINVYSEPGKGTTFNIYLKPHKGETIRSILVSHEGSPKGGSETILFVEDEPMLLELGTQMLQRLGYNVMSALGPLQALEMADCHSGDIDLLITDVVMPTMNGKELWERISAARPKTKCLFTSGYPSQVVTSKGLLEQGINLLQKPLTPALLDRKIREILG